MAQQLPLYQIPMPQGQQQSYNLPPLQMPQQQMQSQMPDFVNNPNIDINTKRQMLNQINQPQVVADVSPQSMAVAGANRKGVDWAGLLGTLGSYVSAAGSAYGASANPSEGFNKAMTGIGQNTQNIRQYDTMKPYYQQMGYDVSKLDPRRGGAGVATNPMEMAKLQSGIEAMKALNEYRQGSLALKEQLGMMTDNTKRANMISSMLNSGTITPQEAVKHMQDYGITFNDMAISNQSRQANIAEQLAPAREAYYRSMPALAGGRLGLQQAEFKIEAPYKQAQTAKILEELGAGGIPLRERTQMQRGVQAVESQVDRFTNTFKNLPTKAESYTAGQVRRVTGMQTPAEANFNSQRTLLFNKIARELGGEKGVLSDQDIARINESLPTLTDSYAQKQAKMQAVYDLMGDVKNRYGMAQGGNRVQPFTPNVNLTPIPQSAFGGGTVRPRQTSKPKAKSTSKKEKTYYF